MAKHNQILDTVDECITNGIRNQILHLVANTPSQADGKTININNQSLINFASCSYMGLDIDERLKRGAIDALEKYGTQFGSTRAYVSAGLYPELESLFSKMFAAPVAIAPSTTLAHQAAIPVLVRDEDAVILDQHVHASVQTTVKMLCPRNIPVELLRHNSLDRLEERIRELGQKHRKIWYMLDGVYSMYGDCAPMKELEMLMNKYEQLMCYVDDAHGMSWTGRHGKGYALDQIKLHPQMVLLTSMNKAFAAAGGAMIFPEQELYRKVRTCGGPLIFSTPIPPPMLGIAVEAAKIHLTDEIYVMQSELKERIQYCQSLLDKYDIPVASRDNSPIFFIAARLPRVGYNLVKRMMQEGYYVSIGLFPAVSMKCTGLRFCVTRHHTLTDIENAVKALAYHYPKALEEEGVTKMDIYKAFKLEFLERELEADVPSSEINLPKTKQITIEHHKSIKDINKTEWDSMFEGRGSFNWEGIQFLERAFKHNEQAEHNWEFDYFIIRHQNKPVAATFFTTTLCKDDMFSPTRISEDVEKKRKDDPYYMCSKIVTMGSMLTEGNHLYIDRESEYWKEAMVLLLNRATQIQEYHKANSITLRDFEASDEELKDFFVGEGFIKIDLPDAHVIKKNMIRWSSIEEYLSLLSYKARHNVRRDTIPYEKYYDIKVIKAANEEEINHLYNLYCNVKAKSLELNTFNLPKSVFRGMIEDKNWEVLTLTLKEEYNDRKEVKPIAVGFIYKGNKVYCPMVVGLDYQYLFTYKNYKQILFQVLKRAQILDFEKIYFGFTASMEKKKIGAQILPKVAFIQSNDSFNMEVLELGMKIGVSYKHDQKVYNETLDSKLNYTYENA